MKVGDKMDFFEALEWKNWKILSDELRMQVMNQVLMYFVSPLKYVSDVEYKEFSLSGVKCRTFECSIDGERFVLVPGNKEAILGWNFGTQGLPVTTWDQKAHTLTNEYQKMKTNYHLKTTEDWDVFVNESTSPLRKVAISPMLVQKEASPVGTTYLGEFNLVTGEFTGEVESFLPIKNQLSHHFCVPESLEACLSFEVPNQLFKKNCYYGQLQLETDTYRLFSHQACTHQTLKQQVHDGVYAWYIRNQDHNFDAILNDINIDESLIQNELQQLLAPVIQHMISSDHLKQRARLHLEKFYYSDHVRKILNAE